MKSLVLALTLFSSTVSAEIIYRSSTEAVVAIPARRYVNMSEYPAYVAKCVGEFNVERAKLVNLGFTIVHEVECRYVNHPHSYGIAGAYGEIFFLR
ncbi:MAG: hypothetical protein AB7F59_14300 [Bdellovibrionales bacterium]